MTFYLRIIIYNNTPLHYVAQNGNQDFAVMLFNNEKINVNCVNVHINSNL